MTSVQLIGRYKDLAESHCIDGLTLDFLRQAYHNHNNARVWLIRNKDHPRQSHYENIHTSNHDNALVYLKFVKLDKLICQKK